MEIRSATPADADKICGIYAYYVEHTAITFDREVPSVEEFSARIARTLQHYPYLVLIDDGEIQGYAYAGPFVGRAAYDRSCELSIYLHHEAHRRGYGRALYAELEERLRAAGILNLYACIGDPIVEDEYLTRNSEQFHAHLGFSKVGTFHKCGHKFDRWYNMIWMEKIIGPHN
ncbi:MAG: GNAT family N-acetyltransferase [Coriobacteriales bacterium]|nr:GNAT family N-acetyltransferase [Coriobacteriales bacterium]